MKFGVRRLVVAASSLALVAAGLAATAVSAQAVAPPPWEPDPTSIGALSFYNAAGTQITGGNVADAPFASYVLAGTAGRAGDNRATVFGYLPKNGVAIGAWTGEALSASTVYPNAAAPAPLGTSALPLVSLTSGDETISQLVGDLPNTATDAYQGLYQLRVKTSGPGQPSGTEYDSADIQVTGSTWTQVYPAVAQSTTTALVVTPASPKPVGTAVTLTATITPSGAAGSVQFKDGATNVGAAVAVSGGTAHTTTSSLTAGTHSLTAVFTPTDSSAFSGSTSSAVSYTITSPATTTTTVLAVTPASPVALGTNVTLKATVAPGTAVGSVQFFDGVSTLGSAVAVSGGIAQLSTTALAGGVHSLSAKFTPTDSAAFTPSTSNTVSYTVTSPATTTTTALEVTPAGPVTAGTAVTLKATLTPTGAAGSVKFFDGATQVGATTAVSAGIAQITTSTLPAGTHSLTAVFTPTNAALFTASTSPAVSLEVDAASTTTVLSVTPASPVTQGTTVTLKATLTPASATGTVQFLDGATNLGSPVAVSGGIASLSTTALTVATHSLTATFTPGNASYLGSTSSAVSYVVNASVAGPTSLTAHVSPGTVTYGATITLSGSLHKTGDGTAVSGAAIAVQSKAVGATTWSALTTAHTSATGAWTATTRPGANRSYRAVFAGDVANLASTSPTVVVVVDPKVTLNKLSHKKVALGTKVKFKGSVSPNLAGRHVSLQYFSHGHWITKKSKTLKSNSTFSIGLKTKSTHDYSWRVVIPASSQYGTGVSHKRKLKVT
jgi:Bacterial Ig-like domain (group 3)